jgi:hypothetical protein
MPLDRVPCDFYADADGRWTYEELVRAARFFEDDIALGTLATTSTATPPAPPSSR